VPTAAGRETKEALELMACVPPVFAAGSVVHPGLPRLQKGFAFRATSQGAAMKKLLLATAFAAALIAPAKAEPPQAAYKIGAGVYPCSEFLLLNGANAVAGDVSPFFA
jgi:hypothetical protein